MERFCSFIGASVKSQRYPYANINRRVQDTAQLRVVRELYDLHDVISFAPSREAEAIGIEGTESLPECMCVSHCLPRLIYFIC